MADAQTNTTLDPYSTLLQNYGPQPAANVIPFRRPVQPTPPAVQPQAQPSLPTPPQAPQLAPLTTQAPAQQITDAFQKMSPSLVLFAALGGALSGNAVASTVNNMAGFLKGVHEGDTEVSAYNLKKFNENFDLAKARNEQAIDQYKLDLQTYGMQSDKLLGALISTAASNGDHVAENLFKSGHIKEGVDYVLSKEKAQYAAQQHADLFNLRVQASLKPAAIALSDGTIQDGFFSPLVGYQDINGNPINKNDVAHVYVGVPSEGIVTPDTAKRAAEMAVDKGDYKDAVASAGGFGNVGNINRGIIANAITDYAKSKGLSGADIAGKITQFHEQMIAASSIGRIAGPAAVGGAEIEQTLPLAVAASTALGTTNYPTVNAVRNAFIRQVGTPEQQANLATLNQFITAMESAYRLVIQRGGTGAVHYQEQAEKLINGTLPIKALIADGEAIRKEGIIVQGATAKALQQTINPTQTTSPSAPISTPGPSSDPFGILP